VYKQNASCVFSNENISSFTATFSSVLWNFVNSIIGIKDCSDHMCESLPASLSIKCANSSQFCSHLSSHQFDSYGMVFAKSSLEEWVVICGIRTFGCSFYRCSKTRLNTSSILILPLSNFNCHGGPPRTRPSRCIMCTHLSFWKNPKVHDMESNIFSVAQGWQVSNMIQSIAASSRLGITLNNSANLGKRLWNRGWESMYMI
jgi:hypothetical protein